MKFTKVKLNDICNLITCGVAKRPNYVGTGVPFLSARNVKKQKIIWNNFRFITQKSHEELTKHNKPLKGDILYTRVGSYGEAAIVEEDREFSLFVSLTLIKPKHDIVYNKFLVYFLNSPMGKLLAKNNVNSSGVGNLNVGKVRNFEIFLPSLQEQQSIVAKLDSVFAEIDRTIEIAEASSIKTQDLFKKELTKTFLTNHEGWIKTTIEESCGIKSGITLKKNLEKLAGDIPYLKVADMNLEHNSEEITTSSRYVMRADISDRMILRKGSVIFPKRGGAIATNKKRLTKIDICVDLNIMSVHPLTSLSPQLLYYFFLNVDMTKLGSGSSIPQINHYDILPLAITYPSNEDEQLKLVKKLKALKDESDSLSKIYYKKIGELKKLKSLILEQKLQLRESA